MLPFFGPPECQHTKCLEHAKIAAATKAWFAFMKPLPPGGQLCKIYVGLTGTLFKLASYPA